MIEECRLCQQRFYCNRGFAMRRDQRTEPVWRLCDRPLETFARPLPVIGRYPTLAGRGGSVSRRDHNQAYQRHVHAAWVRKSVGTHQPIPSRSSGEGVWGGGASLREAASSPESPSQNKNPLPSMQNGSGTMAAYRRDGDYFRDAPSASQAASASASGSSWQVTLSQANTMPAARQLSSQVRIHSPSPQP